ncbi:hypothetical protein EHQ58_06585 [Leptospira ognonensis]|uniref:Uncharacterized protein n=1 Tax=Leptospira ognonensis TaxID=2484945 RepID=A0A4R9K4R9_9LEPT|nr:hypothetical protein [Leptospira ognonensis]TGL60164.1 hypothetical protein EHQ58_06585 [Leptospira ognonensis]
MNRAPLFGLNAGFLSKQSANFTRLFLQKKYNILPENPVSLGSVASPLYPGLGLIKNDLSTPVGKGLIVGSIRMGYGHHRMALSVYSHSLSKRIPTYLHDLLAIESNESKAIQDIDQGYSYLSRLSAEMGGPVEWAWGQLMSQGNLTSLELSCQLAELYKNLMISLPKENPVITTYPLNGQIAVAANFNHVVHLICDNYPQYYLLVPGAMNLVQSPSSYTKFVEMGVPKENLAVAGHWVSEDIVKHAGGDSENRIRRLDERKKRRFLIPIGGAGAQRSFVQDLMLLAKKALLDRDYHFWINTGDHTKVLNGFEEFLNKEKIPYKTLLTWDELLDFLADHPLKEDERDKTPSVVLFNFPSHTEAFSATDKLIRIADILVTKPSELAFFPIPKLFIRRVGDHEAASVTRSLELGEGTVECREIKHAFELVEIFGYSTDLLHRMNERVIKNASDGIYSGSKFAVEMVESLVKN